MKTTVLMSAPLLGAFALGAVCQEPALPTPATPPREIHVDDPRVPIHDAGHDERSGALGVYGAGRNYKARFDDGFTFIPYLGATAPRSLQFRFVTTSVRIGATELLGGAAHDATNTFTDFRHERRNGAVTEVYDLHADGVEQSFRIETARMPGDLVVRGRVTGDYTAPNSAPARQELTFTDAEGRSTLRYGVATLVDADGDEFPVLTTLDGEVLELRVPAATLAHADFPVVVDPWIGSTQVGGVAGLASDMAITRLPVSSGRSLVYAQVRTVSLNDSDLYVYKSNADFTSATLVWSDVTSANSAIEPALAAVAGGGRWLCAYVRQNGDTTYCVHFGKSFTDDTFGNATLTAFTCPQGFQERRPRIGGRTSGSGIVIPPVSALIVRERRAYPGPSNGEIWAATVSVSSNQHQEGTPFKVGGGGSGITQTDAAEPAVSTSARGAQDGWLVAWQQYSTLLQRWGVVVRRIESNGTMSAGSYSASADAGDHLVAPVVDGCDGRFLLGFAAASGTAFPGKLLSPRGTEVRAIRIDWQPNASASPIGASRIWYSRVNRVTKPEGIALDVSTRSHWAMTLSDTDANGCTVQRFGGTGGRLATHSIADGGSVASAITSALPVYDAADDQFAVLFRQSGVLKSGRLTYPALPAPSTFGDACSPAAIAGEGKFRIGSTFAAIRATNAPANAGMFCAISVQSAALPLAWFGIAGGCTLLVDPSPSVFVGAFALNADNGGTARFVLPIPEAVPPVDIFAQYLHLDAVNATMATTRGLRIPLR